MFKQIKSTDRSKISFYSIVIAIVLCLIFLFSDLLDRPSSQILEFISSVLGISFVIISLTTGIYSLKKKENNRWMALVGVILSSAFILLGALILLYLFVWAFL
jgi:RsiW-degrading membrane proteinase PrsW (M82 family)